MNLPEILLPTAADIAEAASRLDGVLRPTPLERNDRLSERYNAEIYLKREDLQIVRSYKLRGAYNRIAALSEEERRGGVVCASAGNHAQGVAYSCRLLDLSGHIYMPANTPRQKIQRTRELGTDGVEIVLIGDTFDTTKREAEQYAREHRLPFIHPFDDPLVIAGQGTIGLEILAQMPSAPDFLVGPVGGGGLLSGIGLCFEENAPATRIIGAEPAGAPSMYEALRQEGPVTLEVIDTFVDGAAVKQVGELTWRLCAKYLKDLLMVPEGQICTEMITLYQRDGIIAEPAGALSVTALEQLKEAIRGRTVVCILSGGNNDIGRYPEILERSLVWRRLKHYFLINFSQRPGALRRFVDEALGPTDDIVLFEYVKKNNREFGPALVGIELAKPGDFTPLIARMKAIGLEVEVLEPGSPAYRVLV